jgi:hypothetical protein
MDNITISTAWTYLSITLQSLNTKGDVQEAVNSYNSVKEQVAGNSQITWKQLMAKLIAETGQDETRKTIEKRLASIPLARAVKYEADFNEILILIDMMGKERPSDTQLADIVKETIGRQGDDALKELLEYAEPDSNKNQSKTSLEGYDWTDLLSFMKKMEHTKAEMRVWKKESSSDESSSKVPNRANKRKKKKKPDRKQRKKAKIEKGDQPKAEKKTDRNKDPCFRCNGTNHSPPNCHFK